ncbi:hypothetical protein [Mesorhizobium sp. KR9-304]|uniref:hypothetical protein n=1 Tax=Mesorhizobium sp. KR9-304 TaxID=3156614 RepID=UPI0032B3F0DF
MAGPQSILDYGAGQSQLVNRLIAPRAKIRHQYDPAIPAISTIPNGSYDIVISVDVLEHLDEPEIDAVLADIKRLSDRAILVADTRPASAILPNGENAHATIQPSSWWAGKIASVFPDSKQIATVGSNAIFTTWRPPLWQTIAANILKPFLRTGEH